MIEAKKDTSVQARRNGDNVEVEFAFGAYNRFLKIMSLDEWQALVYSVSGDCNHDFIVTEWDDKGQPTVQMCTKCKSKRKSERRIEIPHGMMLTSEDDLARWAVNGKVAQQVIDKIIAKLATTGVISTEQWADVQYNIQAGWMMRCALDGDRAVVQYFGFDKHAEASALRAAIETGLPVRIAKAP